MQYVIVKTLPNGQQPGEVLDLPEVVGRALVAAGAVRLVDDATDAKPARRGYRRRDMKARES